MHCGLWVQAVQYNFFSLVFILLCLNMSILSQPVLRLSSTCLNPGVCVCMPRQFDRIVLEFDLSSWLFVYSWSNIWASGINGCWVVSCRRQRMLTQGPIPYPYVSWIFHHSLHFQIYYIDNYHCAVTENDEEIGRVQVVDLC